MNRDDLERQDEETLLQARTNELKQRTAALALERGPYDHAAHESLRLALEQHTQDLANYRKRFFRDAQAEPK